jgi:hypothetical protein
MLDIVIDSRRAIIVLGFSVKRILPYQLRRLETEAYYFTAFG